MEAAAERRVQCNGSIISRYSTQLPHVVHVVFPCPGSVVAVVYETGPEAAVATDSCELMQLKGTRHL